MNKEEIEYKITKLLNDDTFKFNIENRDEKELTIKHTKKLIETTRTCKNFWCKSTFKVKYYEGEDCSEECPKCIDFNTTLSGGVESNEIQYEGLRQDGMMHEIEFHFSKFKEGKGFWNK